MRWLSQLFGRSDEASGSRQENAALPAQLQVAPHELATRAPSRVRVQSPVPSGPSSHPLALFRPAYLTRQPSHIAADTALYAALDLETTGLNPRSARICEVAIVRF